MQFRTRVLPAGIAIVLFVIGLSVRMVGIDVWPYGGDELATTSEESVLFHGAPADIRSQAYRLPHLIPLGYLPIHISHTVFGDSEAGYRMANAILGAGCVVAVFLLLDVNGWRTTAVTSALSVALWSEHVFRSSECRFYGPAALFAFAAMLFAWRATRRYSVSALICSMVCAWSAIFCHSLLFVLIPSLLGIVFLLIKIAGQQVRREYVIVAGVSAGFLALTLVFHVYPLVHGWNAGESWGYSPVHALLAGFVSVGIATIALSVVGGICALVDEDIDSLFWLLMCGVWLGACLLLPLLVSFHVGYIFPLSLGPIVFSSMVLARWARAIADRSVPVSVSVLSLGVVCNSPSLVSHFIDGSRWDERAAARFVTAVWRPGNVVATASVGYFRFYSRDCCSPVVALSQGGAAAEELTRLSKTSSTIWIVLESPREGLPPETKDWLYRCATQRYGMQKRRLDFAEYGISVFEYRGGDPAGCS